MNKILFIDNNRILSDKLSPYLSAESIIIEQSENVDDYMSRIIGGSYSLIAINIQAYTDWITLTVNIRNKSKVPVLILSDTPNSADEITAFRIGADDYVIKTREILSLAARLHALVRRYTLYSEQKKPSRDILTFTGLTIDTMQRVAYKNNSALQLTKTEFNLLCFFAQHKGQTLTKEQIYSNVWNSEYVYDDRNVITHIQRLRHKIEDNPEQPTYIHTVRGFGYQFNYKAICEN
ncbi:MAG: response regulator transcription factor [Clostridiales bacterium]|nr:response regulator transcription factor [Clostridiales bacterium]